MTYYTIKKCHPVNKNPVEYIGKKQLLSNKKLYSLNNHMKQMSHSVLEKEMIKNGIKYKCHGIKCCPCN